MGNRRLRFEFNAHMLARKLAIKPPRSRGTTDLQVALWGSNPSIDGLIDKIGYVDYDPSLTADEFQVIATGPL